jgi:hypothetical protein
MTALAVDAWVAVGERLAHLRSDTTVPSAQALRNSLAMVLEVARSKPHLYALMFTTPTGNPEPLMQAASIAQDLFLEIVTESVDDGSDSRRVGALLMSTAQGIAGMELAGQLDTDKWGNDRRRAPGTDGATPRRLTRDGHGPVRSGEHAANACGSTVNNTSSVATMLRSRT